MISISEKTNNLFIYWLQISLFLILVMIIVGGLTRLTDSGLSITQWELFEGIIPPTNEISWNKYFELYKQIPQFKVLNQTMTLDEFKIIFYWEYAHRFLGRIIGLFILIPLIYFHFIKKINFRHLLPYYIVLILVIIQGIVGWYMVMSGLVNDITVSHYRLSLHLSLAIIIISIIFWQILNFKRKKIKKYFNFTKSNIPFLILFFLIFSQVIFGAFVSGLDAGKIYQTWPLMGTSYFPNDLAFKNFFEILDFANHSLVQFYHRNLAYLIVFYSLFLGFLIFKKKLKNLYFPFIVLLIVLFFQILLGILTLLSDIHIQIASVHQISSVILVLSSLYLYHTAIK